MESGTPAVACPEMAPVDLRSLTSPDEVAVVLAGDGYLADTGLATVVLLALRLRRPLLLEGDAGVGKTEVARALARVGGAELIRLQCYEGIDAAQAVYEWDYARQLLHLRATEAAATIAGAPRSGEGTVDALEDELFSERFLVRRPLLRAVTATDGPPPVLLIDEVDRADDEFEAFLLEVLSDDAVTVPELGTFRAEEPPIVVLTSNRTRDVHDALKRRCLHHWIEHPDVAREVAIVRSRAPQVDPDLALRVATVVDRFRALGLYKTPGVAETIDWAVALRTLGRTVLDADAVRDTIGAVLKYREDQQRVLSSDLDALLGATGERDDAGG